MASYTYQVLKDTTKQTVIKLTGASLTSDESNGARIVANSLYRALDANNNLLVNGNTAEIVIGMDTIPIENSNGDEEINQMEIEIPNTPSISPNYVMDRNSKRKGMGGSRKRKTGRRKKRTTSRKKRNTRRKKNT